MQPPLGLSSNLTGETVGTYAGVSRTVVYLTWPGYLGGRYGSQPLKYYWDKQTGVLVEASATINGVLVTAKATETNMWQAQPEAFPMWIIGGAVVAIALAAVAVLFLIKRK
jgi:hypothetical protein